MLYICTPVSGPRLAGERERERERPRSSKASRGLHTFEDLSLSLLVHDFQLCIVRESSGCSDTITKVQKMEYPFFFAWNNN